MNDDFTLTIPLTPAMHHQAIQLHPPQSGLATAKQGYLNALSVLAVRTYLTWIGIKTDLAASDSWNPAICALMDTAALMVHYQGQQGQLECRPVLQDAQVCQIPPEVWEDRLGYVIVQLNQELTEANLLGFVPKVAGVELPLTEVRSLLELLDRLHPVNLRLWLHNQIDAQWQALEDLFQTPPLSWGFRDGPDRAPQSLESTIPSQWGSDSPRGSAPEQRPLERGKRILFPGHSQADDLILLVAVTPTSPTELEVCVGLCPGGDAPYLPAHLEFMILDNQGNVVMQAQARETKALRLKFSVELGEEFSVRVILGSVRFAETFAA